MLTEVKPHVLVGNVPGAPNHILIEGDNLYVHMTLAYTHEEKINIISVGPPYNTGIRTSCVTIPM